MDPRARVNLGSGSLGAYVPCFNNADTLRRAVESVLAQSMPPAEVLIVDDGSVDGAPEAIDGLPVRVVRHERNLGRGAARGRAMRELRRHAFVLCVDAIDVIPPDFTARALKWMADERVAAVCGRITQLSARNAVERWRGRHLFKQNHAGPVVRRAALSSGGMLVRATSVAAAGGFDETRRQGEDVELGDRLLGAGFEVVRDPALEVGAISTDTLGGVLERYWRWNESANPASPRGYLRQVWYSLKVMAREDVARGDHGAAAISLLCPHYCLGKSLLARRRRQSEASR